MVGKTGTHRVLISISYLKPIRKAHLEVAEPRSKTLYGGQQFDSPKNSVSIEQRKTTKPIHFFYCIDEKKGYD
jgi:hypothetical protein